MSDAGKDRIARDCFHRGSDAVRSGNLDYAIEMFATAVKLSPEDLVYRQALRAAERALHKERRPDGPSTGRKLAQRRLTAAKHGRHWEEVVEAAEEVLRYDPWDSPTLYDLANAMNKLGRTMEAIWVINTAIEADPHDRDVLRLLAEIYEKCGDLEQAKNAWDALSQLGSDMLHGPSSRAIDCFNRGSDAVRSGNLDYAIEMFATAVKLLPDNLVYRQSLRGAERKLYKDNRKGAMMASMKMKPALVKLPVAKKRCRWQDVVDAAEDALRYNPWDSPTLFELGYALNQLGFVPAAIWSLENAIDADHFNRHAIELLAVIYEKTGQIDRAQSAWEALQRIDPSYRGMRVRGATRASYGDPADLTWMHAVGSYYRAQEAARTGKLDYAIELYATAVKLCPENLNFRQTLRAAERQLYKDNRKGVLLARLQIERVLKTLQIAKEQSKWHDVMVLAEDALKYNPWDALTLCELGNAAGTLGYKQMAIWIAETAIDADPKNADAMQLLVRLEQDAGIDYTSFRTPEILVETKGSDHRIRELEATIAADPLNPEHYVQLGDMFRSVNDIAMAIAAYQKGIDLAEGKDAAAIRIKLLDCQIEPFRRNVVLLENMFRRLDKDRPDYLERAKKLRSQHSGNRREIAKRESELLRCMLENNPEDLKLYVELGKRLLSLDALEDAIGALEKGKADPQRAWEANYVLGIVHWRKMDRDAARASWEEALKLAPDEREKEKILLIRARLEEKGGE